MSAIGSRNYEPWWREWPLALAVVTLTLALIGKSWIADALNQPAMLIALLAIICGVILAAAIAIVRHADVLAHRLGEPAGTLLLTLAITGLEVAMVAFVMSTGVAKPTLARDTMFAVVMLVLNGFLGLALLFGGLRHHEQRYNLQSANAFLVMILPLTVLGLVLPDFTRTTVGPTLSTFQMIFLSVMSIGIYGVFLFVQNRRHRGFFMAPDEIAEATAPELAHHSSRSTFYHAAMLGFYGLPLVLLAKQMAAPLDAMVIKLGAPSALGGFIMALAGVDAGIHRSHPRFAGQPSPTFSEHPARFGAGVHRIDHPAGHHSLARHRADTGARAWTTWTR